MPKGILSGVDLQPLKDIVELTERLDSWRREAGRFKKKWQETDAQLGLCNKTIQVLVRVGLVLIAVTGVLDLLTIFVVLHAR